MTMTLFFPNSYESFAVTRNIEDLLAEKIVPIIPTEILKPLIGRQFLSNAISIVSGSSVSCSQ